MLRRIAVALLLPAAAALANETTTEIGGHTKLNATGQSYPSSSLFRDAVGSTAIDATGELRINLGADNGPWSLTADWQLVALHGDTFELGRSLPPGAELLFQTLPEDDRRLFDLTKVVTEGNDHALLHRLDRLAVGYTSEKTVLRLGRQALSWGNGLFYAPMDLVNPFDPAAVDTEYKAGDDMLYLQYLRDNGDDVQAAYVARRDLLSGDTDADDATAAVKYHGFAGELEYDLLLAENYGDAVVGLGGGRSIGGAILRGDVVVTDTDIDTYLQLVANLTYSWVWGGKNMSGAIEYFYNGFGLRAGRYDLTALANEPDLARRLGRGELFSLGRHYLAGSVLIEVTPLWTVTPTVLANVADPSALIQVVTGFSLSDDMTLLGSINLPLGPDGSEFGGIPAGVPDRYLSGGPGLFAQFAWYF